MSSEIITADGSRTTGGFSAHFDGKDYPLLNPTAFDTISLRRIDSKSFDSALKEVGKVIAIVHSVVSKDGKTMTTTIEATNASGHSYSNVLCGAGNERRAAAGLNATMQGVATAEECTCCVLRL